MSAILLVENSEVNQSKIDRARGEFSKKSFKLKEESFLLGEHQLYFYHDLFGASDKIYQNDKGDIFVVAGTIIYEKKTGASALKAIERSLDRGDRLENMVFSGSYLLIVYRNGELQVSRDIFGTIGCYTNTSENWCTTNFLAAVILHGSCEFSKNELLESILFGFSFGYNSIVQGILLLEPTKIFNLSRKTSINKKIKLPRIETDRTKCLHDTLDILIEEFDGYAQAIGNKFVSALSGGYDSRLMLALMKEVDVIPELYVYGKDADKDVIVAKEIADGEGLILQHIDRNVFPQIPTSEFGTVVESNYYDLDLQANILANQADLTTRLLRSKKGGLLLNGSGGEIFRDVWKWDFKSVSLFEIFKNHYNMRGLEELVLDVDDFFENIESKMRHILSQFVEVGKQISRQHAELLFPIHRSKFYYPSNTLNNYLGSATFPFMSEPVVLQSFAVPHRFKHYGEFERLLIKTLNPKLASYKSAYGFSFSAGPGLIRKIMERTYSILPPEIKMKVKFISSNKKSLFKDPRAGHIYLQHEYLTQIFNTNDLKMEAYIDNLNRITNWSVLERIYTFEYFSNKNDIS